MGEGGVVISGLVMSSLHTTHKPCRNRQVTGGGCSGRPMDATTTCVITLRMDCERDNELTNGTVQLTTINSCTRVCHFEPSEVGWNYVAESTIYTSRRVRSCQGTNEPTMKSQHRHRETQWRTYLISDG